MFKLDTDILKISRVGQATAKRLKKIGIENVNDLIFYFPFRYDDFSKISKIDELQTGMSANVIGQIELIQNRRSFRRKMNITEALVSDESETLKVIWFNQPFIARNLKIGDCISLAGKVDGDYNDVFMKSPVYEKIQNPHTPLAKEGNIAVHTQGLVPNYHLTSNITQKQIRFLIKQVIDSVKLIHDWLPAEIQKNLRLISLSQAISKIHFPKNQKSINEAKRRLAFDEVFLIQLQSCLTKIELQSNKAEPIEFKEKETNKFVKSLLFKLTDAQRKVSWNILQDLAKDKPMSRLLEGDVGSGKTLVAIITMLNVVLSKKQAVLMVPTEILARQHYETICHWLKIFNIKIGLVTSNDKKINYKFNEKEEKIKKSQLVIDNSQIVIGTHALIQEKIEFKDLALVIIDEQHRFGVYQRKILTEKISPLSSPYQGEEKKERLVPHFLSMTATPIPRSLALALYGDLDLSIIDEMPKGRKKILTKIVEEDKRQQTYNFIRQEIKNGRQVFVICPLIDISDKLGFKSVKEEFKKLNEIIFSDLNIGMLHGKLKSQEKENVMKEFLDNKIKILVSTSVVEVGVDVPNATIMMIEGADRFGLAQIHQFRGRVGRSDFQSHCFLFTDSESARTKERLQAIVDYHSGLELARMDLKFRGPGEVYGTIQKGFPELKIASLYDYELMKLAKEQAEKIIEKDKDLNNWPLLKEKLGEWEKKVHLE